MDRTRLPLEMQDMTGMIPPAPEYVGQLGAPAPQYPPSSPESPQTNVSPGSNVPGPTAPVNDPSLDSTGSLDQVLSGMVANAQQNPSSKRKNLNVPKPSEDLVRSIARTQQMRYADRDARIARDVELYRQRVSFVPGDFDKRHDTPVVSASIPNLVNKVTNMLSSPEPRIIVPYHDEQSKVGSQAIENFGYWCRKLTRKYYSQSGGGNLQWDEFFYLNLHGMLVARVLPDPDDEDYPFRFSLVDPSSCYPVYKGDKSGLHTMIRLYRSTALDILGDYGANDPKLERKLQKEMGFTSQSDLRELYDSEGDTIEYWDKRFRCVIWRDIVVMPVTEHGYDCGVPFVCVIPKGEPKSLSSPLTGGDRVDEFNNVLNGQGRVFDTSQKGVSIFHHLIQTNRVAEILHTINLMEIEKALNPPTITYVAPQYMGEDPGPLNLRKRGNNKRLLNFHKVEAVPTSPRPTDFAPLMNKVMSDLAEGSLPPVVHGNESGSNVSGFAVESLIATAKDVTLPYTLAFETYLAQIIEMKLSHYKQFVLPFRTISVPSKRTYGHTPMMELTQEIIDDVGISDVEVKLWAMSQQLLPSQINAAIMAVQGGIWSLRKGMEHAGSLDPDADFKDIIAERAIQHPAIMENYIIPQAFYQNGQPEMAELWMQFVVMPKLMSAMMGGQVPGGEQGPPGQPSAGKVPEPNGQSNPVQGDKAVSTGGGPGTGKTPGSEK